MSLRRLILLEPLSLFSVHLLFASSNPHKVREVHAILRAMKIDVIGLDAVEHAGHEPVEDGLTTAEMTALVIKAIMAAVVANAGDLPADLVNDLGGALGDLVSRKDLGLTQIVEIKELKEAQDVAKSVDDAVKGLGSLFGGKKPGG